MSTWNSKFLCSHRSRTKTKTTISPFLLHLLIRSYFSARFLMMFHMMLSANPSTHYLVVLHGVACIQIDWHVDVTA